MTVYVKKHPCPRQQPTGYGNSSVSRFSLKPRKAKLPFQVASFLWAYLDTLSNVSALLACLMAGCALGTPSPRACTTLTASDPNNGTTALGGLGADSTRRLTDEGVHCHRPPPPGFTGWPPQCSHATGMPCGSSQGPRPSRQLQWEDHPQAGWAPKNHACRVTRKRHEELDGDEAGGSAQSRLKRHLRLARSLTGLFKAPGSQQAGGRGF